MLFTCNRGSSSLFFAKQCHGDLYSLCGSRLHSLRCAIRGTHTHVTHTVGSTPPTKKSKASAGFWQDPSNRRQFFDNLAQDLNVRHADDWYNISVQDVRSRGGSGLLREYFGDSLLRALESVYPEHRWEAHRFAKAPNSFWKDLRNQRQFFERLAVDLNIKQLDDWYNVKVEDARSRGGRTLLNNYYGGSLLAALRAVYPEHSWDKAPSASSSTSSLSPNNNNNNNNNNNPNNNNNNNNKNNKVPVGYWKDPQNRRRFFDKLAQDLGIRAPGDWNNVTVAQVHSHGGRTLLSNYYGNSLMRALRELYPELQHHWRVPEKRPALLEDSLNRQRELLEGVGRKLGVTKLDDWLARRITKEDVYANGGRALLERHYGGSLSRALRAVYPDHPWPQPKPPNGFWKDMQNQRNFFEKLSLELGIKHLDEWYTVTVDTIYSRGGKGLLSHYYGNSLLRALQAVYPEHQWDPMRFAKVPHRFWKDPSNHRKLFDTVIGVKLNITSLDDWYKFSSNDVLSVGDRGLLSKYYGRSLPRALQAIYPEHPWQSWKFHRIPSSSSTATAASSTHHNYNDNGDLIAFLDALAAELNIQHLDDWYRISRKQIEDTGGYCYIKRNGGLPLVLKRVFPHHSWDESRFTINSNKKAEQRWLVLSLRKLFPHTEILEDYLHPELCFPGTQQATDRARRHHPLAVACL